MKIGVIGSGTMGSGIAQVAAQNGHLVYLIDTSQQALDKAKTNLSQTLNRLVDKEKITSEQAIQIGSSIQYSTDLNDLSPCGLVIEAIVENLSIKHELLKKLETVVSIDCVLASNTSSLSIASLGSILNNSNRIIGIHFFNPAPLMPLVEIIPAVQTSELVLESITEIIQKWGKIGVICKDTPGFIVNRVARPFYGEALRIYEEGIADFATIDWAMTHFGGFKMGPFTLMDYIGNDVNYSVTESVFESFYFDPRFKPSFTQKRHKEAGYFGRKSGRGYYDYTEGVELPIPNENEEIGILIFNRILAMLINEAIDAVFMQVGTIDAIDLAMTKGVNYPKGLLKWADEIGLPKILGQLEDLFSTYGEDRYRPNALLRKMVKEQKSFY
jgi:3-hydroxybutyryl-CoA dehydrogenase